MTAIQFVRLLWARRWIVITATIFSLIGAIAALATQPRIYAATSRLMLTGGSDTASGTAILNRSFARTYIPSEVAFIASNRVGVRTATNLGWTRDPVVRQRYDEFVASAPDKDNIPSFENWLAGRITPNIDAEEFQTTNIIDITYTSATADNASEMANAVRQAYYDEKIAQKRDDASAAVAMLDRQMDDITKRRDAAQQRLVQYQKNNGVTVFADGTDAGSNQLSAISRSYRSAAALLAGSSGNPNAAAIASLDAKIATESQTLGPNHPIIEDLRKQRAALASAPVASAKRVIDGPSQASQIAEQSAKVLGQQDKVTEAKRLQYDVDALTALYQALAARKAQLRQDMNSNAYAVVMLDAASPPRSPANPNVLAVLFGSIGFGFATGMLLAVIVEFLRLRIRATEDLAAATPVPLIAVISEPPVPLKG